MKLNTVRFSHLIYEDVFQMDSLDIDKKRAIELGVRYVDVHWKSVIESEIEVSVLRYIRLLYLSNLFHVMNLDFWNKIAVDSAAVCI